MVRYQLAGDLYEEPTDDQLIASGFHRLHLIIDRGTALPEESYFKNVVDRVSAVGTTFMGMTVHCAQCHDHKYDPITQKDFYSLFAFFNNIDGEPETNGGEKYGLQPPFVSFAFTRNSKQNWIKLNQQLADLEDKVKSGKTGIRCRDGSRQKSRTGQQSSRHWNNSAIPSGANETRSIETVPRAMVMKERAEIRHDAYPDARAIRCAGRIRSSAAHLISCRR